MRTNESTRKIRSRGFTLMEIMVVVAIIIILATIGIFVGMHVKQTGAEKYTLTTLTALDSAMSDFLKEHPAPTSANWAQALRASGKANGINFENDTVLDGYGSPIRFLPPNVAPNNTPIARFRSNGVDEKPDTGDDVDSKGAAAQ